MKFLKVVGLSVLLSGCYTLGPNELRGTRPLYNQAIVETVDEQFLTNLVRLKYRDTPYFMDVSSIVTSVKLDVAGGLNGSQIAIDKPVTNFMKFDAGLDYAQTPTITYQPVEGEAFVRKFLTPLSIDSLALLVKSGWSFKRVFGLCLEEVNGIHNAITASGPTPKIPPTEYEQFNQLLELLENLRNSDVVHFDIDPVERTVKVEFTPTPETVGDIDQIKQLLELDHRTNEFQVTADMVHQGPNTIAIRTRSPLSVLFYLSQNVDAPDEHKEMGLVTVTRDAKGIPFDWGHTPAGASFKVHSSSSRPDSAFTAVPYRDYWFYLDDADLESKSSFMLMSQIFRLQAGTVATNAPVLTIPVAR